MHPTHDSDLSAANLGLFFWGALQHSQPGIAAITHLSMELPPVHHTHHSDLSTANPGCPFGYIGGADDLQVVLQKKELKMYIGSTKREVHISR